MRLLERHWIGRRVLSCAYDSARSHNTATSLANVLRQNRVHDFRREVFKNWLYMRVHFSIALKESLKTLFGDAFDPRSFVLNWRKSFSFFEFHLFPSLLSDLFWAPLSNDSSNLSLRCVKVFILRRQWFLKVKPVFNPIAKVLVSIGCHWHSKGLWWLRGFWFCEWELTGWLLNAWTILFNETLDALCFSPHERGFKKSSGKLLDVGIWLMNSWLSLVTQSVFSGVWVRIGRVLSWSILKRSWNWTHPLRTGNCFSLGSNWF